MLSLQPSAAKESIVLKRMTKYDVDPIDDPSVHELQTQSDTGDEADISEGEFSDSGDEIHKRTSVLPEKSSIKPTNSDSETVNVEANSDISELGKTRFSLRMTTIGDNPSRKFTDEGEGMVLRSSGLWPSMKDEQSQDCGSLGKREMSRISDRPHSRSSFRKAGVLEIQAHITGQEIQKTCLICLEDFSKLYTARQSDWCKQHFVCAPCQIEYIRNKVVDGKPTIHCVVGCDNCAFVATLDSLDNRMEPSVMLLLRENRLKAEFNFKCTKCSGDEFSLGPLVVSIKNCDTFICRRCSAEYCLFCRDNVQSTPKSRGIFLGKHKGHLCSRAESRMLAKYALDSNNQVKPCPHCFRFTHKYDGCANMSCTGACGRLYCWNCLTPKHHSSDECRAIISPPRIPRNSVKLGSISRKMRVASWKTIHAARWAIESPVRKVISRFHGSSQDLEPFEEIVNVVDHE